MPIADVPRSIRLKPDPTSDAASGVASEVATEVASDFSRTSEGVLDTMRSVVASVFKSVAVAHDVYRANTLPQGAATYTHDTLTLGWEERLKIRARRTSDRGVEFATALPRATALREGDLLVLDALQLVVRIVERPEPVFVVRPTSPLEWALFAYHIGNSHQPMMLAEDGIVCADILGMAQVLTYHGIPFERMERSFTPVGQLPAHQHAAAR